MFSHFSQLHTRLNRESISYRIVFQHLPALLAMAIFFVLLRHHLWSKLSTHVFGGRTGDSALYFWLAQVNTRDFWTSAWFSTPAFYPYGKTLAWSDNFIFPSALTAVFRSIGLSFVESYNLSIMLSQYLTGFAVYMLGIALFQKRLPSFFCAVGFMNLGVFSAYSSYNQIQFFFWIPLALAHCIFFLRGASPAHGLGMGLGICGAFLSCAYWSILLVLCLSLCFLIILCRHIKSLPNDSFCDALQLKVFRFGFFSLIPLLALIPFIVPYYQVKQTFGTRPITEFSMYAATTFSYMRPATRTLHQAWLDPKMLGDKLHDQFFPGVVLLGIVILSILKLTEFKNRYYLPLFGLSALILFLGASPQSNRILLSCCIWLFISVLFASAVRKSNQAWARLIFFLTGISFVLSLGPLADYGFFEVLYRFFPGFSVLRLISRVGVLTLLFSTILAGFFLSDLQLKKQWCCVLLLLPLVLIENHTHAYSTQKYINQHSLAALLKEQEEGAALILPISSRGKSNQRESSEIETNKLQMRYLMQSFEAHKPLVNGYSGQGSRLLSQLAKSTGSFPAPRSIEALSTIAGLRWIVYRANYLQPLSSNDFLIRQIQIPGLKFIGKDKSNNFLFELEGLANLKPGLVIWTPAYENGRLNFELRSSAMSTTVSQMTLVQSDTQSQQISWPSDNKWHAFEIELKVAENQVLPRRLEIRDLSNSGEIRRVRWKAGHESSY